MDTEAKLQRLRAATLGSNAALTALLGALIETHPNKELFTRALNEQRRLGLQFLEAAYAPLALPSLAVEAFDGTAERVLIEPGSASAASPRQDALARSHES